MRKATIIVILAIAMIGAVLVNAVADHSNDSATCKRLNMAKLYDVMRMSAGEKALFPAANETLKSGTLNGNKKGTGMITLVGLQSNTTYTVEFDGQFLANFTTRAAPQSRSRQAWLDNAQVKYNLSEGNYSGRFTVSSPKGVQFTTKELNFTVGRCTKKVCREVELPDEQVNG